MGEHCQRLMEIFDEDNNGVISKTEFVSLAQYIFVMQWLEEQQANAGNEDKIALEKWPEEQANPGKENKLALEFEAEILEGEYRTEQLLAMFGSDKAGMKKVIGDISRSTDLPEWFRSELCSPAFESQCAATFTTLDVDGNGVLSLDELYPVIEEMTGEHPISITIDHCRQLMAIVDSDENGTISKDEFKEFTQFVCLMKWLEGLVDEQDVVESKEAIPNEVTDLRMKTRESLEKAAENGALLSILEAELEVEADELRVNQLLDMIEADSTALKKNFKRASLCPDMPAWMLEIFAQPDFEAEVNAKYDALDADGNGTLSPDELYPVILEMSGGHPMSVTIDHCRRLTKMFDEEKKGVLSRREFVDLVKFIWLHLWLEEQRLQQMMDCDSLEAEWRIANLLDIWRHNMRGLKDRFGSVCNSPDVPDWLKATLQESAMTEMCHNQFVELDKDKNGVLTADELLPVIVELCQEHPVDITQEHCQTMLDIFDADKSGTIERGEFLEFVRFMVVVTWLQEQDVANMAPPPTPSMRSMRSDSDIEDRTCSKGLGDRPNLGTEQSPESKAFNGELMATQEALAATQEQLRAVQTQLQATTGQVAQALSAASMGSSPVHDDERWQWQQKTEQLMKDLATAQQLAEMQKKGMAETVGKLMSDKMELESQLMMAKMGK